MTLALEKAHLLHHVDVTLLTDTYRPSPSLRPTLSPLRWTVYRNKVESLYSTAQPSVWLRAVSFTVRLPHRNPGLLLNERLYPRCAQIVRLVPPSAVLYLSDRSHVLVREVNRHIGI